MTTLAPFSKEIETILRSSPRPEVDLFQYYVVKSAENREAYVAALIGALLVERKRCEHSAG
ncbi:MULTISPECIES: hypothetical protein [unclassified Paraburkholderia]|uniref:hypothetical protein n=1 Tax=unclassified Paraburkholderia TaxID=2615204 RepID=UPI00160AAB80|nr:MULTISPECIES: hypothetical protein [unclassified Paraburkholderia]MBB5443263.1 hypothetical protein [Paraburkholderia sp. WSM4177]MBB5483131.1 hypothetical protein [Paraburkholderia sp. WSM4180]